MSYNSYEIRKGVQHILENNPHDIKMIERFYNGKNMLTCDIKIPLGDILSNKYWTAPEKKYLIEFFKYIFEYETSKKYKTISPYNIAPIDFVILLENITGIIGFLNAGGHLTTNSFENIKRSITSPAQKAKILNVLYNLYSKEGVINVIDYENQELKTFPLNDYLGSLLANDYETTQLLPTLQTDINLVHKLLYYTILSDNKQQTKFLMSVISNYFKDAPSPKKTIYPELIKKLIKENNLETLKAIYLTNPDHDTILLPPDKTASKNNIFSYKTPLTPLQYALRTINIKKDSEENITKKCDIIDYLYQIEPDDFKTSSTYSQIIGLLIYAGNIKKAKFYYDDALNKNIELDFSFTITEYEENLYKCYIKHSINN